MAVLRVAVVVCDTQTVGGWKLSMKIRNRVGTPLEERVCESVVGGEEPVSGYTGEVVARCAKVAQHWALRAIEKKEREEERIKIIVVEYYYYYQTQERNAHYYYCTAVYYNTAAVYDTHFI